MRHLVTFCILICYSVLVLAQNKTEFADTESRIMLIPKTATKSVNDIAAYINSNFKTEDQKLRAVFYWIAQSVWYDVPSMNSNKLYDNEQQVIDEVLKTRKGVCGHFATLFSWICNEVGIRTFVVRGITKQNGKLDNTAHAWVVSFVNNKWQIIDPTWGSGHLLDGKYVRQIDNQFYLQKPENSIRYRYPFDPQWQLVDNPVSFGSFTKGVADAKKTEYFNFNDSIKVYEKLSDTDKKIAVLHRLEATEINNSLYQDYVHNLKVEVSTLRNNASIDIFNNAVGFLNNAVNDINEFIDYRNKQFIPKRSDVAIKLMLSNVEVEIAKYKNLISEIDFADPVLKQSMYDADKFMQSLSQALIEQKAFLDKYMSTPKFFRKSLFYHYQWMGIPLNQQQ